MDVRFIAQNLLTEELEKVEPVQRTTFNIYESVGGLEKSQFIGALPRGRKSSILRSTYDDPIYCITLSMTSYAENCKERYIRSYTNDDGMSLQKRG